MRGRRKYSIKTTPPTNTIPRRAISISTSSSRNVIKVTNHSDIKIISCPVDFIDKDFDL